MASVVGKLTDCNAAENGALLHRPTDFHGRCSHMRVLLGLAALGAIAAASPALAQSFSTATFGASDAVPWVASTPQAGHRRGGGTDVRIHRGYGAYGGYAYAGYNGYGDFDGNRSFDPDKWNDWWHDRPDRAYPRWMSRNQDCARPWYSGDMLTC
jgi:hypothetical protein